MLTPADDDPHARAADAAVIARLWHAARTEPLPAVRTVHLGDAAHVDVALHDGRLLRGPWPRDHVPDRPLHTAVQLNGAPVTDPVMLAGALAGDLRHADRLREEVAASAFGLAAALAAAVPHPHPSRLWHAARRRHLDPGVYFEQIVVDGHPVHPLCRCRGAMTAAQLHANAPEHRPHLQLKLTALPASASHVVGDWPWRRGSQPLLPVHPLQTDDHGDVVDALPATPLMSLRTLAATTPRPCHVKTALDLQMTSARRRVSPASLHNGPVMSRLVATLTAGSEFGVQPDTAGLAAVGGDGAADPAAAAIVRPAPTQLLPPDAVALPVAALSARDPRHGRPLVADIVASSGISAPHWWRRCVEILTAQPLRLAAVYGIGLEAHGQNLLLACRDGAPAGALYRDFGGVRVHRPRLRRAHGHAPTLHGDVDCADPAQVRVKLVAALFTVTLGQLVDAMTHGLHQHPRQLWRVVADAAARGAHPDPALQACLFADTWPIKATTAMRLADDDLADVWAQVPNPIAAWA